jgi:tRNA modification GTPase
VDLLGERREAKGEERIFLSAKSGNVEVLKEQLITYATEQCYMRNAVTISNTRHYEALVRAQDAIKRVQDGLHMQISGEFLSMDLQDCLTALGEITGQISSQEVLNNIFSKFCIGK